MWSLNYFKSHSTLALHYFSPVHTRSFRVIIDGEERLILISSTLINPIGCVVRVFTLRLSVSAVFCNINTLWERDFEAYTEKFCIKSIKPILHISSSSMNTEKHHMSSMLLCVNGRYGPSASCTMMTACSPPCEKDLMA